jgi:polyvinyl alcohol dehydrogenase (cytochrome)
MAAMKTIFSVLLLIVPAWSLMFSSAYAQQVSGEAVYKQRCAGCHEVVNPRIPPRDALQKMSAARILRALDFGVMMNVAYPLRRDEREAVAAFLGGSAADSLPASKGYCSDRSVKLPARAKAEWNGWSPNTTNARFQAANAAGLNAQGVRNLKLKWAFGFDGDVNATAQPAVIDEYLFIGSAGGTINALHTGTGCLKWAFQAGGPVRTAILVAPLNRGHALLFGDQTGWFYSVEAETGKLQWKKKIEEHEATRLTGSPIVHEGVVFIPVASWEETRALGSTYACCTFRGSVVALRVRDGSLVWKTYTIAETPAPRGKTRDGIAIWGPSGAGIWSAPTLDTRRRVLYVTTGDNYSTPATDTSDAVIALSLANGKIVWSKQVTAGDAYNSACGTRGANCPEENGPDYDFGASAILVRLSNTRDLLVAGQKSGVVYALDPDKKGEIVWQSRVGKGGVNGGVQWGMASDGRKIYAAVSDVGRTRRTNVEPFDTGLPLVDPKQGGGLTALGVVDGEKVWYAPPAPCDAKPGCSPAQSAAVTAIPGVVFSGSIDGHLRAFNSDDGTVLWDFDTAREYETVNGVRAGGGSLDGPGATVAGGMVFVNSGYSRNGGMAGNVLLAFEAER